MNALERGIELFLIERLKQVWAACCKQLEGVEQLEQDGAFSKDESDAERVRIAAQKAAAKEEYYRDMNATGARQEDGGGVRGDDCGCDCGVDRGGGHGWCI